MILSPEVVLKNLKAFLPELQKKYGVTRIGLFGSYVRKEASPISDIDIIVTFEEKRETFDNYMDLKNFLEDFFDIPVDLVIADTIKSRIKNQILQEAIYA